MSSWARKLPTRMVEKVWGRTDLPSPFTAPEGQRIGEIWFEPPPEMPQLLVKYLFTSEKLSVQVHPSNSSVLPGEESKEECWLVLDAEPGSQLAIGFNQELEIAQIEAAARDGSIESLLTWHDVVPGDVFFLPAGTVHAIGPGLSLVEVQQNSDTTFRLYDYGRPRDLHLDRALAVLDRGPYLQRFRGSIAEHAPTLIEADHFRLDRIEGAPDVATQAAYPSALLVLPLSGWLTCGDMRVSAGECLYADSIDALDFGDAGITLLTRAV